MDICLSLGSCNWKVCLCFIVTQTDMSSAGHKISACMSQQASNPLRRPTMVPRFVSKFPRFGEILLEMFDILGQNRLALTKRLPYLVRAHLFYFHPFSGGCHDPFDLFRPILFHLILGDGSECVGFRKCSCAIVLSVGTRSSRHLSISVELRPCPPAREGCRDRENMEK